MDAVFMRWDVEDFLTPAADWALDRILSLLAAYGVRANFAVVGRKAQALRDRGRASFVARMARQGTVGYHSWSHSVHPTLAEALDPLDADTAAAAFVHRERRGVDLLSAMGAPPQFFTQPGGNWIPEALTAGRALGVRAFISDEWNGYYTPSPRPVWVGDVLYWSLPVDIPKGWMFRLPESRDLALAGMAAAWAAGRVAGFVSHPTELVTRGFWDAANYAAGVNRAPLVPAPTRPAAEWETALGALERVVADLAARQVRWITVDDLPERPPKPGRREREAVRNTLRRSGLGPGDGLTAAEEVWALAWWQAAGDSHPVEIPVVGAPTGRAHGTDAAAAVLRWVETTGTLPAYVEERPLDDVVRKILEYHEVNEVPWRFRQWVRPVEALHWDWPIFPPDFKAPRLWQEAHRLAWTIRPAAVFWEAGQPG